MKRWLRHTWLLLAPLALSVAVVGCGSGSRHDNGDDDEKQGDDKKVAAPKADRKKAGGGPTDGGPATGGPLKPVAVDGKATIKGRVLLDGPEPDYADLHAKFLANVVKDQGVCLAPDAKEFEKTQYQWVVDKGSRGVKNVFVWLRPAEGTFFDVSKLKEGDNYPAEVSLDQPHCAFIPHALVLFPKYIDPGKPSADFKSMKSSPQVFRVTNDASVQHNVSASGIGFSLNEALSPGGKKLVRLNPSYTQPVNISCSIHSWMKAYAWAFDHPYAAVTDEKGEFVIKNAPSGVKCHLVVWHESVERGWVNGDQWGKAIELKAGDNDQGTIPIKAR